MDDQEAYEELGLDPSASDAQVKATWRRLVAAWHPDRNAAENAPARMQLINKAYQHIRQLRDGNNNDELDTANAESPESTPNTGADRQHPETAQKTHLHTVRLTLEDAIFGCTRTIRGQFTHGCDACAGNGHRVLAKVCANCRGSGAVRKATLFGWLWNDASCTDCGGDGRQRAPCETCEGSGERTVTYRRRIRFPAGVRDGHILCLPTPRHDGVEVGLELRVEIESHPLFSLDEAGMLRCEMPVNGYAWMAGRWVEVPTPQGVQQMRLNRDALVYRLRGQGFPCAPHGPRGDYMVKVVPVFPAHEDTAQELLLDQLIASSTRAAESNPSQPLGQWQRRMKRWNSKQKPD